MSRKGYLRAVIDLYLAAPGSPKRATRADWAIAATLYDRQIPIKRLAHAIRIATLRCHLPSHGLASSPSVRSLAYYRTVAQRLSGAECESGYVDYVTKSYTTLLEDCQQPPTEPENAPWPPEERDS